MTHATIARTVPRHQRDAGRDRPLWAHLSEVKGSPERKPPVPSRERTEDKVGNSSKPEPTSPVSPTTSPAPIAKDTSRTTTPDNPVTVAPSALALGAGFMGDAGADPGATPTISSINRPTLHRPSSSLRRCVPPGAP